MKIHNRQSAFQGTTAFHHSPRQNRTSGSYLLVDKRLLRTVNPLLLTSFFGTLALVNLLAHGDEPEPASQVPRLQQFATQSQTAKPSNIASSEVAAQKGRTAFVSASQALVYSGPAEEFYPTTRLRQGTAVEVFYETKTGWAAIRPPKGSFSWIPASEVFLLPGGKSAEVSTDNSVSWIGTSLGTANQYRWQVKLNRGEQLSVIGEETMKEAEGRESLWYRIAPPSGEFRWIQTGIIASEPPESLAGQVLPSSPADPSESGISGDKSTDVQPAAYDGKLIQEPAGASLLGQILDGEIVEGEMIDGDFVDGEYIVDGEVIDGGIYYEDPALVSGVPSEFALSQEPDASWDDWQLFEFTDEGLRFPLWERSLNKRAHLSDPLAHDPFSLAMAPKTKGPKLRSVMQEPEIPVVHRRRTPWRDPRMLAEQRLQGYPQASAERGTGATLSAIRDAFNSPGKARSDGFSSPANNGGLTPVPDYYRDHNQPRPAPDLDLGTNNLSGNSAINGGGSIGARFGAEASGLSLGPSFLGSNQPLESNTYVSQGGNWLSQNWNGLQQNFKDSRVGVLNAGSSLLLQLQNRLNEIVTQPMIQWNFGTIKQQVQQVIQGGQTPVERGQARLLLERIEAFEQLALRTGYSLASLPAANSSQLGYSASPSPVYSGYPPVTTASYLARPSDDFSSRSAAGNLNMSSPGAFAESVDNRDAGKSSSATLPFDASGWLVPVFASTSGQPTHAITDDQGHIVAYVTGLPGMNLDRYVNQAVGIHGLRGYLPQLQAAHIEAQTIVRIR